MGGEVMTTDERKCIAPDQEHNYGVTEDNAVYASEGTLYSLKGGVTCSICQDARRVYELSETQRYPLNRALARERVGRFVPGHSDRIEIQPRPMSESYALWALESYGIDAAKILPHGLGAEIPSAGMWEGRAPGDIWVTASTSGRLDGEAGYVWTVTAGQLARIPLLGES
jgi:hypothetical protein